MSDIEIRVMTNKTKGFYTQVGPFLARREIVTELGGHLWDDDDKTWFVAIKGRTVIGFCAARPVAGKTTYLSAYVVPGHRRQGVYRRLWQERRAQFPGPARATCTTASLPVFLANGWVVAGTKGSYQKLASA